MAKQYRSECSAKPSAIAGIAIGNADAFADDTDPFDRLRAGDTDTKRADDCNGHLQRQQFFAERSNYQKRRDRHMEEYEWKQHVGRLRATPFAYGVCRHFATRTLSRHGGYGIRPVRRWRGFQLHVPEDGNMELPRPHQFDGVWKSSRC